MERLFNYTSKFTLLQEDPTLCNLSTVRTYLNTLHKRNEITLEDKNLVRPKLPKLGVLTVYQISTKIIKIYHLFGP